MTDVKKTAEVNTSEFRELGSYMSKYICLPAGSYITTGVRYNAGDECKAITVIRYASGGSGRDLMGYSTAGSGYWGVTAAGAWEPRGHTFLYTNSDITKLNTITYVFSSSTENGVYNIGRLATSYSVRQKYVYNVKLYKNGTLVSDLFPHEVNGSKGMIDVLDGTFYPAVNTCSIGTDNLYSNVASITNNDNIIAQSFIEI